MKFIKNLISKEASIIKNLHCDVRETFKFRSKDRESWSNSCSRLHSYKSKMDVYLKNINEESLLSNSTVEFSIAYLEVNPYYFRSGYIKEVILHKIKRVKLSNQQKSRLLYVLRDAAKNRGVREYKYYCRLAKVIKNLDLIVYLEKLSSKGNLEESNRAEVMLSYLIE